MIEVTIKLRYPVDLAEDSAYPGCLDEQDAADHDKRQYETGFIDLFDLFSWAGARYEDGFVNNVPTMDVAWEVVPDPGSDAVGTHL